MTSGLAHPYHLDESTFNFRDIRSSFFISISFFKENHASKQNSLDGILRFAASHLGLFCLSMSHKKDARFIWVNTVF